jgi:hypothetical protein
VGFGPVVGFDADGLDGAGGVLFPGHVVSIGRRRGATVGGASGRSATLMMGCTAVGTALTAVAADAIGAGATVGSAGAALAGVAEGMAVWGTPRAPCMIAIATAPNPSTAATLAPIAVGRIDVLGGLSTRVVVPPTVQAGAAYTVPGVPAGAVGRHGRVVASVGDCDGPKRSCAAQGADP